MKNIFIIFLTSIITIITYAQNPVITSYTPTSGPVGTIVKITGYNFKVGGTPIPDAKSNTTPNALPLDWTKVTFGNYPNAYNAYPTIETATYIEVPVPNGIPLGSYPLKVQNANATTTATPYFTVTTPPPPPPPPISNVALLHGFSAGAADMQSLQQQIYNQFSVSYPTNAGYNGLASISGTATNSAQTLVPYSNTVVVAHSMGGVLAREIRRQQGTNSKVAALITIGTPHKGAPIASNAQSNLGILTSSWLNDLAYGWAALFYWDYFNIAAYYLAPLIDIINLAFDPAKLNSTAAQDLRPGSSFINTLNANPSTTLPPAHYTIYGREDWQSHWRLADAYANNGVETGSKVQFVQDVVSIYVWNTGVALNLAYAYLDMYYLTYDYYYIDEYLYWLSVANAFDWGQFALSNLHQADWNAVMVGEPLTWNDVYARNTLNDAFIPKWSQAPDFVDMLRHIEVFPINHNEETTNPIVYTQVRNALRRPDINVPFR